MPLLVELAGFVGAWLLVAGPLYQAAIELAGEEVDRDVLAAAKATVTPPANPSAWWWLLPPVYLILRQWRSRGYRAQVMEALSADQFEGWVQFSRKATAWLTVGAGGVLLATKETWELVEALDWPVWSFWVIAVVVFAFCAMITVLRQRRDARSLREAESRAAGSVEGG